MKKAINIALYTTLAVLLLSALAIGVAGNRRQHAAVKCTGISVELTDSLNNHFVSAREVQRVIDREFGGYLNVPVGSIDLDAMERVLEQHGTLEKGDAFFTRDGILHVRVKQRKPLVKLYDGSTMWYVCSGGKHFAVKDDWCRDIPRVNGAARLSDPQWRQRMAAFGEYVTRRGDWDSRVERISTDSRGEVSIKLQERDELFYIGQPTEIKEKFARIDRYIGTIVPTLEEGRKYKSVNVKFNNQIVCK